MANCLGCEFHSDYNKLNHRVYSDRFEIYFEFKFKIKIDIIKNIINEFEKLLFLDYITELRKFYKLQYNFDDYKRPFSHSEYHTCAKYCNMCYRVECVPAQNQYQFKCRHCYKRCKNKMCVIMHEARFCR